MVGTSSPIFLQSAAFAQVELVCNVFSAFLLLLCAVKGKLLGERSGGAGGGRLSP